MKFEIECEFDNLAVRGNVLDSGDAKEDRKCEDEIIDRLESGDVWAWCCVRVYVELDNGSRVYSNYLGGCSYADEQDFRSNSGYFNDMCEEIRSALKAACAELAS